MSSTKGVELKGGMYTFMSLRVLTADIDTIDTQLADKVQQAPGFFKDTPVVVDLSVIEENQQTIDAVALLDCVRSHALRPIVACLSNKTSPLAESITIPLVEGGSRRSTTGNTPDGEQSRDIDGGESSRQSGVQTPAAPAAASDFATMSSRKVEYVVKSPTLIDKPVRSGQQVYARDTDLIVMGQVGPGAEVIADNNIHVYGPLRGRALCGVSGNTGSRIFCQSLEAELVSVAGNYRMLETIPEELRGKPAQIWLDNERLNIEPL